MPSMFQHLYVTGVFELRGHLDNLEIETDALDSPRAWPTSRSS
jgi:hypothetical protein